jgi:hypothetical protein
MLFLVSVEKADKANKYAFNEIFRFYCGLIKGVGSSDFIISLEAQYP